MARYRTKPQVVDAVQAMNGLWMIRTVDSKNNVELIDVMTHKAFLEKYEPFGEGDVDESPLLCARCRAPLCPSSCTGQHFKGAAWEPPETPRGRQ